MLQAVGMHDEHGNKIGYRIHHEGKVYEAFRTPDERFKCEGFVGTLKQVKQNIQAGGLDHFADATQRPETPHNDEGLADNPDAWNCVPPCAMLILFCTALDHPEVLRTLDAYGWLLPDGTPNIEDARYQMNKRRKR